jgi:hypothetical protein
VESTGVDERLGVAVTTEPRTACWTDDCGAGADADTSVCAVIDTVFEGAVGIAAETELTAACENEF